MIREKEKLDCATAQPNFFSLSFFFLFVLSAKSVLYILVLSVLQIISYPRFMRVDQAALFQKLPVRTKLYVVIRNKLLFLITF